MNVPALPYDPNGDNLQFSKSPNRYRNNQFMQNQTISRDRNDFYNSSIRSPQGRNMQNSMHSIEMTNPMSSIPNAGKFMVYQGGDVADTYQSHTTINLGIINDNRQQPKASQRRQGNNISMKKNLPTRGNFRKNKKTRKPQGVKEYYDKINVGYLVYALEYEYG